MKPRRGKDSGEEAGDVMQQARNGAGDSDNNSHELLERIKRITEENEKLKNEAKQVFYYSVIKC